MSVCVCVCLCIVLASEYHRGTNMYIVLHAHVYVQKCILK